MLIIILIPLCSFCYVINFLNIEVLKLTVQRLYDQLNNLFFFVDILYDYGNGFYRSCGFFLIFMDSQISDNVALVN